MKTFTRYLSFFAAALFAASPAIFAQPTPSDTQAVMVKKADGALVTPTAGLKYTTGQTVTFATGSTLTLASGATFTLPSLSIPWATVSKSGSSLADLPTRLFSDLQSKPTSAAGYGITNGAAIDTIGANGSAFYLARANHTGTQLAATISDFNAAAISAGSATYQPLDADLTSIAANSTGGFLTRTASNTYTPRTITGTAGEIDVANGDGVSGNPTISLPTALTGVNSVTAAASTDLTLTGGSGGSPASIVAKANGDVNLNPAAAGSVNVTTTGTAYLNFTATGGINANVTYAGLNYIQLQTGGKVSLPQTTASTSTTTGSLINAGGFGNAGAMYVGAGAQIASGASDTRSLRLTENGTRTLDFTLTSSNTADLAANVPIRVTSTTAATSTTSGSFINAGGFGNAGDIFAPQYYSTSAGYYWQSASVTRARLYLASATSLRLYNGTTDSVSFDLTNSAVSVNGTTASTSTTTGSLVTAGGLGVAGAAYIGGQVRPTGDIRFNSTDNYIYTDSGSSLTGIEFSQNNNILNFFTANAIRASINSTGVFALTNANDATSTATGSFQTAGGVGIAKALYVGSTITAALTGTSGATDSALNLTTTQTTTGSGTKIRFGSTTYAGLAEIHGGNVAGGQDGFLDFYVRTGGTPTRYGRFTSTGNLLLGTTTDSSNGKLQLATHTAATGGVGFGSSFSTWTPSAGKLRLSGDITGATAYLEVDQSNTHLVKTYSVLNPAYSSSSIGNQVIGVKAGTTSTDMGGFGGYFTAANTASPALTRWFIGVGGSSELLTISPTATSVTPTTASSSSTTGSLTNAGGFGNAGAAYVGGILASGTTSGGTGQIGSGFSSATRDAFSAVDSNATGSWVFGPNTGPTGGTFTFRNVTNSFNALTLPASASGTMAVNATTASTSSTTGALTVAGGLGVAGAGYFGGDNGINLTTAGASQANLNLTRGTASTGSGAGAGQINFYNGAANRTAIIEGVVDAGGAVNNGRIAFWTLNAGSVTEWMRLGSTGTLSLLATTDATSTTAASLTTAGGAAVAKKLFVGDHVTIGTGTAAASGEQLRIGNVTSVFTTENTTRVRLDNNQATGYATIDLYNAGLDYASMFITGSTYAGLGGSFQRTVAIDGSGRPIKFVGGGTVWGGFDTSGSFSLASTTASTSTTTGSLVNAGGFGNAGKAYFGDFVNIRTSTAQSGLDIGATTANQASIYLRSTNVGSVDWRIFRNASDGLGIEQNGNAALTFASSTRDASFGSTTEATTGGAGSLTTAGGIYAAKKIVSATGIQTGGANSTAVRFIASASASIDFINIATGTSTESPITVTGATQGDPVALGITSGGWNGGTVITAYVSAANTVQVRLSNFSGSDVDLGAMTFRVTVFGQ